MGVVGSMLKRRLRRYNVENRARKVISREKPVPAPQYESVRRQLEIADKMNPNFMEMYNKKDIMLDKHLKDVYVKSHDEETAPEIDKSTSNKSLPRNKASFNDFEYGAYEPTKVSVGKCTLRQAVAFLMENDAKPTTYTAANIATEYKLDQKTVENILKYYSIHKVYIPVVEDKNKKNALTVQEEKAVRK